MAFDIIIFALIAAFLIFRLNNVLGTRHGDERQRPNPFEAAPDAKGPAHSGPVIDGEVRPMPTTAPVVIGDAIDPAEDSEGKIRAGVEDIAAADPGFQPLDFLSGARAAFEMVVTAYARGERETLKNLLSPRLYKEFSAGIDARVASGQTTDITLHRILRARIVEAHLGGTMAYVTVDFDVEQTTVTRDASGAVIDGDANRIFMVKDIWTFTRDTRATDPNWILIETRAGEQTDGESA